MAGQAATEVVGALGSGVVSPLLGVRRWGDHAQRVVLRRGSVDVALDAIHHPRVVVPHDAVASAQGRFLICRWVDGHDLDAVIEAGLSERAGWQVVGAISALLRVIHDAGAAHGALDEGSVRIAPDGAVVLVGTRGVGADDWARLRILAERCLPTSDLPDLADDEALAERERAAAGPALIGLPEVEPPLAPHRLSGQQLTVAEETGAPPKVRLAGTAAITLLLGLGLGLLAGGSNAGAPGVSVPGAVAVSVRCAQSTLPGPDCVVEARLPDGRTLEGTVGKQASGVTCRVDAAALRCP